MNSFEASISAALGEKKAGKIFLAAVSGGADSTAMLAGLAELRKEVGLILHVVHVEHGIRPAGESRGDADAVDELCKKLDVPCQRVTIPQGKIAGFAVKHGMGIEAAARAFRYRSLIREGRRIGADWVLTAHTRDDALENLLMRILRGSGPAGLTIIPRQRGKILRPILDFSRQDILAYLKERGLSYRIDSTNTDIHFLRNKVRCKLIPLLDEYFPSWKTSILALAETQSFAADFLAAETEKNLPWEKENGLLKMREAVFFGAHQILQEEAIFAGVDKLAAETAGKNPVLHGAAPRRAALRSALKEGVPPRTDLGPVCLKRQNGFITLSNAKPAGKKSDFSLLIKEAGSLSIKGSLLGMKKPLELIIGKTPPLGGQKETEKSFMALVKDNTVEIKTGLFPLLFRKHREGDRLLWGGHKRSLSDILPKGTRLPCLCVITVCDINGTAAVIAAGKDGNILAINRAAAD